MLERDERIQQMTLTMTDLEAANRRTAELRELKVNGSMEHELNSARRSERTRSRGASLLIPPLVRSHES